MAGNNKVIRLQCVPQTYEWGKVGADSLVADFGPQACGPDWKLGKSTPYAELWMGTHPNGSARIHHSVDKATPTLSSHLAAYPELLGVCHDTERFPVPAPAGGGAREEKQVDEVRHLPFLFKILTCKQALPLQIHPDKQLSKELHERDPSKFGDWNHKPEIAVALTPFLGFAGFMPLATIRSALQTVPELKALLASYKSYTDFATAPSNTTLRALVKDILLMNTETNVANAPVAAAAEYVGQAIGLKPGPASTTIKSLLERVDTEGTSVFDGIEGFDQDQKARVVAALAKMNRYYAGDPGVLVCAFCMNLISLQPGESIYVGADGVHAWLDGQIVELMATSDNVMNLAFVPNKEKDDVNVFIDSVTCEPMAGHQYKLDRSAWKQSTGRSATVYKVPTEEFSIYHVEPTGDTTIKPLSGPSVAIVTDLSGPSGTLSVKGETTILLQRGMVFFIGAGAEVQYSEGVEVWSAFFDDKAEEQTGDML